MSSYDLFRKEIQDVPDELDEAAEAVRNWDGYITKDSVGATIFRFWREAYSTKHVEVNYETQATTYPRSESDKRDAMDALVDAVKRLKEMHGTALMPWGDMLRLRHGSINLPLSGDAGANMSESMRATCSGILNEQGKFIFSGGQVVTTVVSLTDPIQVHSIVPYGQSSKPDSKHYSDQMRLYSDDRMRPAWHDWHQLKDHIESSETIIYTRQ